MPRRITLTERQMDVLLRLPTSQQELVKHYTLSDEDLARIRRKRRPHNKFGFALQLCVLRHPGRILAPGELIPAELTEYLSAQLGLSAADLADYSARRFTRNEHLAELRALYGYQVFSGVRARSLKEWLINEARLATSSEDMALRFVAECRRNRTILPAPSTLERLCANALVSAERQLEKKIVDRLSSDLKIRLNELLTEQVDGSTSRFVWLRQYQAGGNSSAANHLLDRLDFLKGLRLPENLTDAVPAHRVTRLRRQGERYYADGMREVPDDRRLAILAVCAMEWRTMIADAVIETHDRIVGRLYRNCERIHEAKIVDQAAATRNTLLSFATVGAVIIEAHEEGVGIEETIANHLGWKQLNELVMTARSLTRQTADPLDHVLNGYHRFRRYAPRMLRSFELCAAPAARPLLEAVNYLREEKSGDRPNFLRPSSKWQRQLSARETDTSRLWETAVLFQLRDAFRSGDIWFSGSRRYGDVKQALVPMQTVVECGHLAVPLRPAEWLCERIELLDNRLRKLSHAAQVGTLPNGSIIGGVLHIEKLEASVSDGTEDLILDLYKHVPRTRITDLLLQVDDEIGFSEAFTNLRTGAPCKDRVGLLNVILAEGINLGLRKMAEACNSHGFWELIRIARWHVESDAYERALAMVVQAQTRLPFAQVWGQGTSASSDGQFFPTTEKGEALNLVNAKYGNTPGLKAYTHVSDQYAPFATQVIPATASEAPYILDGLLMNETGLKIREQFSDTAGFTDHVFAACSILGYRFAPRIRDLASKRFYAFNPAGAPEHVRSLIGGKINQPLIERNWPDILRVAASMAAGTVAPSQILRKLASYPRQNELALALREVGRIERTLFMIDWILDVDLQRRAQAGINKGEAHHALKRAISFHRRGEIRDRSMEGQHYRVAGLNLLAAIIIYWNTSKLGEVVSRLKRKGKPLPVDLLAQVSPLAWEHINLTGEYRWPKALA